jgi:hypothetical protein
MVNPAAGSRFRSASPIAVTGVSTPHRSVKRSLWNLT